MTSTTEAPRALTTPFIPPQGCADQFLTTSIVSSYYWNDYSTMTASVLVSGPADARFSACQPPGWQEDTGLNFSPAVCPSGWTAYNLGAASTGIGSPAITREKTFSHAFCCSSGFTFSAIPNFPISDMSDMACFAELSGKQTPTSTGVEATETADLTAEASTGAPLTSVLNFVNGVRVHNPWHIMWESTDVSSLSPSPPPPLGCSTYVLESWVPGSTVDPRMIIGDKDTCNDGTSHSDLGSLVMFAEVGVPLIVLALIGGCCGVYFCRQGDRKRARRLRQAQTVPDNVILADIPGK